MHCPGLYYCWSWPVYHYYYQHYALPCAILLLQLTSISLLLSTLCVTLRYTTITADQYIVININTKHCPALYYCWSWAVYHYYYQHYALSWHCVCVCVRTCMRVCVWLVLLSCAILLLELTGISLLLSTLSVVLSYTTVGAGQYITIIINTTHCPDTVCVCVCVCAHMQACVCVVSVIGKRPVLPPSVVDGRSRNSLYYYYYTTIGADQYIVIIINTMRYPVLYYY